MTGLDYLVATGTDTFCSICGEWLDMSSDIFGGASDEGRRINGFLVCTACEDRQAEADVEL